MDRHAPAAKKTKDASPDWLHIYQDLANLGFPLKKLESLRQSHCLERLLLPKFEEFSSDDRFAVLVTWLLHAKISRGISPWTCFVGFQNMFETLFNCWLRLSLASTLSFKTRSVIIGLLINAFNSLDVAYVQKACQPLVSILSWTCMSSDEIREHHLSMNPAFRKRWRLRVKALNSSEESTKSRLLLCASYVKDLAIECISLLFIDRNDSETMRYCERIFELFIDMVSQLPTRRYTIYLLRELHILTAARLAPRYRAPESIRLRQLFELLSHYMRFGFDDVKGLEMSPQEVHEAHSTEIKILQQIAFTDFNDKLVILALSNFRAVDTREELMPHIISLTLDETVRLCQRLHLRTSYPIPGPTIDNRFLVEVLMDKFVRTQSWRDKVAALSLFPTEKSLFTETLSQLASYDSLTSLAIPKLNLQYLSIGDFLYRAMMLSYIGAFYDVRCDLESIVARLQPQIVFPARTTRFLGTSSASLFISGLSILEVAPPNVGTDHPGFVRAELTLDLDPVSEAVRAEWENLPPGEVLYLLQIEASDETVHGVATPGDPDFAVKVGIRNIRCAVMDAVFDAEGRPFIRTDDEDPYERLRSGRTRSLRVNLDPVAFKADKEADREDIYGKINVLIRRDRTVNQYLPVLSALKRSVVNNRHCVPSWLHDIFLGFGDPAAASYGSTPSQATEIRLLGLSTTHSQFRRVFPDKQIEATQEAFDGPLSVKSLESHARPDNEQEEVMHLSQFSLLDEGPSSREGINIQANAVHDAELRALYCAASAGLTIIDGGPGTGHIEIAARAIHNIYYNNPSQQTLVVAQTAGTLDFLFKKLHDLQISEYHMLRLEEPNSAVDLPEHDEKGRIGSFMKRRLQLLAEVSRLAAALKVGGAHGASCETAAYFYTTIVLPGWQRFVSQLETADGTDTEAASSVFSNFPYTSFFFNAPQPLFPVSNNFPSNANLAYGCFRHISKLFSEINDIRPFELLKKRRDQESYLLTNVSKVIAATATHLSMETNSIAKLDFRYDNIVVLDAAIVNEIQGFSAFMLAPHDNVIQRLILIGDARQPGLKVKHASLGRLANVGQSLFSRLLKQGVPAINLTLQKTIRPSLLNLYESYYPDLHSLDVIKADPIFGANAGIAREFQFVDVTEYNGRGESEPSPGYYQNLGEAEYSVALYQYMRLLGYPASKIAILTAYPGQTALIQDVIGNRCLRNPLFGAPGHVTDVNNFQSQQSDCKF